MFASALGEAISIFPLKGLPIFGLELHAFGFLVGTGIILGTILAQKRAKTLGLSEAVVAEIALWAVIPGFIGAHLVHQLLYFPEQLVDHVVDGRTVLGDPWLILKFWQGISSFGGFVGGTLGVVWYFKRRRKDLPFLPYADSIIFGFCFAWIFGRMGCTTAFDHPGFATDFFLGMQYNPDSRSELAGQTLHNLGFYELLWTCLMFTVFWLSRKATHFKGWYLAMFIVMYMPVRFFLDFLRKVDVRYAGLTPGQWIAIVLFGFGLAIIYLASKRGDMLVPDGLPKYEYWPNGKTASNGDAAAASRKKGKG